MYVTLLQNASKHAGTKINLVINSIYKNRKEMKHMFNIMFPSYSQFYL